RGLKVFPFVLTPNGLQSYLSAESQQKYCYFCQLFADGVNKYIGINEEFVGITSYVEDYETNTVVVSTLSPVDNIQHFYTITWDVNIQYDQFMDITPIISLKSSDDYLWDEIFSCPANGLIYSVTSNYWEDVCPMKREYDIRQSVFNIGPDLYHQTGHTRHRVTGYSVESRVNPGYYKVIIHGMSSHAYRSLGRYIFAMFEY
ncbi:unnamed protein product, partial [Medioppia subpectinata]